MKKGILYLSSIVLLFSCQSDDNDTTDNSLTAAEVTSVALEYVKVNEIFSNVSSTVEDSVVESESDSGSASQKSLVSILPEYPIITVSPLDLTTFPKQITVDFGSEGVLGPDLVTRKGIINIVSDNWYHEENSKHTTTFTNYYHNSNKVEGTHISTSKGQNTDGNYQVEVQVIDGKITFEDATSVSFDQETTRILIAGADTPFNIWDNEYLILGTQNGVNSEDIPYSVSTEEALHIKLNPRSVLDGILRLVIGDLEDITLDYENSTFTYKGVSYDF